MAGWASCFAANGFLGALHAIPAFGFLRLFLADPVDGFPEKEIGKADIIALLFKWLLGKTNSTALDKPAPRLL